MAPGFLACRGSRWRAGSVRAVFVLGWVLAAGGCSGHHAEDKWGDLEYDPSEVRTATEQIAAQRALQDDAGAVTGPYELRPAKMLSQTMTEEQRQAFQRRYTEALYQRAEQYHREAEQQRTETLEAQEKSRRGRGRQ